MGFDVLIKQAIASLLSKHGLTEEVIKHKAIEAHACVLQFAQTVIGKVNEIQRDQAECKQILREIQALQIASLKTQNDMRSVVQGVVPCGECYSPDGEEVELLQSTFERIG